jgi:hypothetical protein
MALPAGRARRPLCIEYGLDRGDGTRIDERDTRRAGEFLKV